MKHVSLIECCLVCIQLSDKLIFSVTKYLNEFIFLRLKLGFDFLQVLLVLVVQLQRLEREVMSYPPFLAAVCSLLQVCEWTPLGF